MKKSTSMPSEVIWITGASSGLGLELARQLAAAGHHIIASARNIDSLNALSEDFPNVDVMCLDVADKNSMQALPSRLLSISSSLDRIILNAGQCEYLYFPNPDWRAIDRVFDVNFFGVVHCVECALPLLEKAKQGRGHIIGVGSLVTTLNFPRCEAYGASKAAMQYFLNSLRLDLKHKKIDVTVVDPGFIDTPMTRKNPFEMPFLMPVDEAANRILTSMISRPRRYAFPKRLHYMLKICSFFPKLWEKKMAQPNATSTDSPY